MQLFFENRKNPGEIFVLAFICALLFHLAPVILLSQMPDWRTVKDREGNIYYIDKNGKIWTSGKPEFEYRPVSADGLDYYINQGAELVKRHYKLQGLTILKSIKALPLKDQRVYDAQARASREINSLIKREGDRFKDLNERASLLLFRDEKEITIIDDIMAYSITLPGNIRILKRTIRKKYDYSYHGLYIGIYFNNNEKKKESGRYDALLAVSSEIFRNDIRSIRIVEQNWKNNLGDNDFIRKRVEDTDSKIVYEFSTGHKPDMAGYEAFYMKGRSGHFFRIITGKDMFSKNKRELKAVLDSFMK